MSEFLQAILGFPTVVLTALLGFVLGYWLLVILGAIDLEALDLGGVGEALEGTLDTLESVLDGAAEGAFEGVAEGALDGVGEGLDADLEAEASDGGILSFLGLTEVPVTVSVSVLILFGWFLTLIGTTYLAPSLGGGLLVLVAVLVGAMAISLFVTRLAIHPLRPIFEKNPAPRRSSFVGKVSVIATNRVSDDFGQAEIDDGGAGLLVAVRCLKDNNMTRGDKALVYDYLADEEVYLVAPLDQAIERGSKWLEE